MGSLSRACGMIAVNRPARVKLVAGSFRSLCKRSLPLVTLVNAAHFAVKHYRTTKQDRRSRRARTEVFRSYFHSHVTRKLQIGTGQNILPDWLNTDLEPCDGRVAFLDASEPLPFDDGAFDYVFSEHFIEHISYAQGLSMLEECCRVLKPGGRIRIATPNLNNIIALCRPPIGDLQQRYIKLCTDMHWPQVGSYSAGIVVNNFFRYWGHQFIYDPETLGAALGRAGFCDVKWFTPGESADENLRALEGHHRVIGDEMNAFETMVAEAARPEADRAPAS